MPVNDFTNAAKWFLDQSDKGGTVLAPAIEEIHRKAPKPKVMSKPQTDVPEEIMYTRRMGKLELKARMKLPDQNLRDVLTREELVQLAKWCIEVRDDKLLERILVDEMLDPFTIIDGKPLVKHLVRDRRYDTGERYYNTVVTLRRAVENWERLGRERVRLGLTRGVQHWGS